MQSTNPNSTATSSSQPGTTTLRNRMLVLFFALLLVGVLVFLRIGAKPDLTKQEQYYDPGSGETVTNPAGKTPEFVDTQQNLPIVLGIGKLLDIGFTEDQLTGVKIAYSRLPQIKDSPDIKEASITVASITSAPFDIAAPSQTVTFETTINRSGKLFATVNYGGLSSVRLILRETQDSEPIFDSGEITEVDVADLDYTGD